MIFWPVLTPLDSLLIYFPLFQLVLYLRAELVHSASILLLHISHLFVDFQLFRVEQCLHGRVVSALCFSPTAESGKLNSTPVPPWSLWLLMSSAQIQLYAQ